MTTMRWSPRRVLGAALAAGALASFTAAAPAAAQQATPRAGRADCRCVDRDGKEIENCRCLRTPSIEGPLAWTFALRDSRARLGITLDVERRDEARGARVESVLDEGPAADAGIREGDVITSVDGKSLITALDPDTEARFDLDGNVPAQRLLALASDLEAGQEVRVEYLRDGERRTATVTAERLAGWGPARLVGPEWDAQAMGERMRVLGDRLRELRVEVPEGRVHVWADSLHGPEMTLRALPREGVIGLGRGTLGRVWECPGGSGATPALRSFSNACIGGLALTDLNPGLGEYFGAAGGVLVSDVTEGSSLGLRPGDVILAVGEREATDADHVRRILASYGADESITFRVLRQKREMSVQGTLGR